MFGEVKMVGMSSAVLQAGFSLFGGKLWLSLKLTLKLYCHSAGTHWCVNDRDEFRCCLIEAMFISSSVFILNSFE